MLVHLGCLQEGVGKVLEGCWGSVKQKWRLGAATLPVPGTALLPWREVGGDGTCTPEPAAAMPELAGRSWVGTGSVTSGDWAWGLVKLWLGCPVVR